LLKIKFFDNIRYNNFIINAEVFMRILSPSFEIVYMPSGSEILKLIELAGRTCYKSEDRITKNSSREFVKMLLKSGHHSVIEHLSISVKFICDRGVSHELVRHRLASYSQESTRYANYSKDKFGKEISVIKPLFWEENTNEYKKWKDAMLNAEEFYMDLISSGAKPEQARSVLPNSLKTEIVMSCNIREWRHVLNLRCSKAAHPQIREIMIPLLAYFHKEIPVLFDDLYEKYNT
jgi:thymidylate synthase (FAD)